MGMTHHYPTSKCQQIVLAGLGLSAENYTEAEQLFERIGILVTAVRQGRSSVPVISAKKPHGYAEEELFNDNYADVIRENLSQYCSEDFLKMITPVAKPEQKEETTVEANNEASLESVLAASESGMIEAAYGDMDVIVAFDDESDAYVAKYVYGLMPPHTVRSAPTIEQLLKENPELRDLHWTAVEEDE